MTECVCGPGSVGGTGWQADCPVHNVRELLKATPGFDPDTIEERVRAKLDVVPDTPPAP